MNTVEMLRELEAKATPGPWRVHTQTASHAVETGDGYLVCAVDPAASSLPGTNHAPNMSLIAAMRNAMPALLAELEAARKVVEALDEAYAELLADSHRDGPRCLLLTHIESALAAHKEATK